MDSLISKIQAITTEEDMRDQTKLIMQPNTNWENYLTPAPLSIAILGELVLISSKSDFSISKNPGSTDGFKFISYPDSFRACLMQVCHFGWRAFNTAHKNMDQIRLLTAQVPNSMGVALQILVNGNEELIKNLLPGKLGDIQTIADKCVQLSIAAEKGFTDVIDITDELLTACMHAKKVYLDDMEENQKKLEVTKQKKQAAEEAKESFKKAMSVLKKELDQANQNYQKAMDSLPSGWEMIGMNFVEGIANGITTLLNGFASSAPQMLNKSFAPTGEEGKGDWIDEISVFSKSAQILQCAQNILQQIGVKSRDEEIDWKNIYDQEKECTRTDFFREQFERIQNELEKLPDSLGKTQAQQLNIKGINVCQQLAKYAPHGKCDKAKSTEIIDEVFDLIQSARIFDTKSKDTTNSPPMSPKPPTMYEHANGSGHTSTTEMVMQNARLTIEQTQAQLNKTAERYDKGIEKLEQSQKEEYEFLATIKDCQMKEIDFNTTIKILIKGMESLGNVEQQWKKMVQFFEMISNIVEISLSTSLTTFVSESKVQHKLTYTKDMFLIDLLYKQAFQASNIASLVHMISSTYTAVSEQYILDPISSLDKLMAMDASDPKFMHEQQQLKNSCDEAQKAILGLVRKNKEDFDQKCKARLEQIKQELFPSLPTAPPEQIKSIQEAVQAGFSEEGHHI